MKYRRCWLCALAGLAAVGSAAGQEGKTTQGRKYFIGVGVETYDPEFFHKLSFAEADVVALGETLRGLGFQTLLMTSKSDIPAHKPTDAQNILNLVERSAKKLEAGDTLVVVLSGHGVQFKGDKPASDGSRESYFCPERANLTQRESLVPMSKILVAISDCKAERKLLVVDACRNEAIAKPARASKEIDLGSVGAVTRTVPKGMLALFSCTEKEKSYELPELKHGVFSYHLLKYLKGEAGPYPRGQLSLVEMANYARRETTDYVFAKLNADQSPLLISPGGVVDWPLGKIIKLEPRIKNSLGAEMVLIPAGEFLMGSPEGEEGRNGNEKQVHVTLSKPFYMGLTEVTQGQWKALMGTEPWKNDNDDGLREGRDYPAVLVSWNDAKEFCKKLSAKEGMNYRLPTEAEWEYACRGGTKTAYCFGDKPDALGEYAWFSGNTHFGPNSIKRMQQVAQKKPNPFGLYDMHGNVYELCEDQLVRTLPGGRDPLVRSGEILERSGRTAQVYRSGTYGHDASTSRSARRDGFSANSSYCYLGFRLAMSPPEK